MSSGDEPIFPIIATKILNGDGTPGKHDAGIGEIQPSEGKCRGSLRVIETDVDTINYHENSWLQHASRLAPRLPTSDGPQARHFAFLASGHRAAPVWNCAACDVGVAESVDAPDFDWSARGEIRGAEPLKFGES
jgi:hypothetical protein